MQDMLRPLRILSMIVEYCFDYLLLYFENAVLLCSLYYIYKLSSYPILHQKKQVFLMNDSEDIKKVELVVKRANSNIFIKFSLKTYNKKFIFIYCAQ